MSPDPGLVPPLRPRRAPWGCAAVLLPHRADGTIDWASFRSLLERTVEAGLTPAVNMDTGFVQLLDPALRGSVLATTSEVLGERARAVGTEAVPFLAGAFVADRAGEAFALDQYLSELVAVQEAGGTPVVFPSHGLNDLPPDSWVEAHRRFATEVDRFVAFELGDRFVPYGRIYPLDAYQGLLEIESCIGAKHSSLSRTEEWARLSLRDAVRPDFHVLTGNDLAIDMICWGSDYLLGLAAFAPDHFARRDAAWAAGDPAFHELNDRLQYLGAFSFRDPVPAYRHDAALFLHERGWIESPMLPDGAPRRPSSDIDVLALVVAELEGAR